MASVMPSDHEYLRQDYPHASLTIPQLRNILFTHGIEYPSSAKKALLLQTFRRVVLPNAAEILREKNNVQRSTKGISNCYSTSEAESSDSDDNAGSYRPISDARNGKGKSLHTPSRPGTLSASNSLPQPVSSSLRTTELLKEEISQLEQGRRARLPRDDIAQARVLKAALKLIENQNLQLASQATKIEEFMKDMQRSLWRLQQEWET